MEKETHRNRERSWEVGTKAERQIHRQTDVRTDRQTERQYGRDIIVSKDRLFIDFSSGWSLIPLTETIVLTLKLTSSRTILAIQIDQDGFLICISLRPRHRSILLCAGLESRLWSNLDKETSHRHLRDWLSQHCKHIWRGFWVKYWPMKGLEEWWRL